jgi:hypothetical protein
VFRAVNLYQLAKAIAPAAWLMRGRQIMAAVYPQTRRDHPAAQRFTRDRAAVYLRQLLRRQCRTKISVSFAHQRQRQITIRLRQTVVARPAPPLRDQAGPAAMFQIRQQPKNVAPLQAE